MITHAHRDVYTVSYPILFFIIGLQSRGEGQEVRTESINRSDVHGSCMLTKLQLSNWLRPNTHTWCYLCYVLIYCIITSCYIYSVYTSIFCQYYFCYLFSLSCFPVVLCSIWVLLLMLYTLSTSCYVSSVIYDFVLNIYIYYYTGYTL